MSTTHFASMKGGEGGGLQKYELQQTKTDLTEHDHFDKALLSAGSRTRVTMMRNTLPT